ncbi:glutathione S-transferase family protein [Pseudomaricurvus alkylphenolicus]|uniref:glutathione S-transferase family protein n=1 Tax=Pseudomaricurvus alkylphenolicus TaxID=1306991 RepID=UPI0014204762|nr:glutathione S-transferase family protein [Pseudomaricurvus alkylphenolicus]NIB40818.1 glutathione S-transferase family protein [Pseudomaricurvus alkylphenolicus]
MKLYNSDIQSNPRRVRMFLAEKELTLDTIDIDIFSGGQFSPEFKNKSPLWDIPLLELDNGQCITQVNAICRYLETLYPTPPLFGTTAQEQAQVEMWNHIAFINGMQAIAEVARNSMPVFEGRALLGAHSFDQIPALAERGQQRMRTFMLDINHRLSEEKFLAGTEFSVADITAFVAIDLALSNGIEQPSECSSLSEWLTKMRSRPSASA